MQSHCVTSPILPIPLITRSIQSHRTHFPNRNPNPIITASPLQSKHFPASFTPKSSSTSNSQPIPTSELDPIPPSGRIFTSTDIASLWIGLVVGVPSYYLAGSLVNLGMSWWQGVLTVFLANLITLIALILTGVPGTKYGISFPVLARSSFGVHGAHVPTLLRALVGCGWYGIETWIGGQAIFLLLPSFVKKSAFATYQPRYLGTTIMEFLCFIIFWSAQLLIVMKGMEGIKELEKYSAPMLIVLTSALLCWAYVNAGGFGHMLTLTSKLNGPKFWAVFFPSLTANVSFWAPLVLNISDFTRYARSQKDQVLGQMGLPVFMGLFTFVGLAVASSTEVIFGSLISDPIQLLGTIGGFWTTIVAIIGISLATITTNIAANVVAPANALVNLDPKAFNFRKGALVTALVGIAFQPWKLLASSESFVYTWLVGYSALMGPIAGVLIADYYFVKGMELNVEDLYNESEGGRYFYRGGFNVAGLVALVVGILPIVPGFLEKAGILGGVKDLFGVAYSNSWFVSFFVSGFVYWLFSKFARNGHNLRYV